MPSMKMWYEDWIEAVLWETLTLGGDYVSDGEDALCDGEQAAFTLVHHVLPTQNKRLGWLGTASYHGRPNLSKTRVLHAAL